MNTREFFESLWAFILSLFNGGYTPPGSGMWKASMFFPHKYCGTNTTPPWAGNRGTDSTLAYAYCYGEQTAGARIKNMFQWQEAMGSDTMLYIAEHLFNNIPAQMHLTNRKHPETGKREDENEVIKARDYGVGRWIVDLFNDEDTKISWAQVEGYIKQITDCYDWASGDEVAYMVCLETDERFNVAQVCQIVDWIAKYAPGKRIIVGSANENFLKKCAAAGVELWAETAFFPFDLNANNAPGYIATLERLQSYGRVWAGEYGDGRSPIVAAVSAQAVDAGCIGIGSYMK